jgi:hypothetical protein
MDGMFRRIGNDFLNLFAHVGASSMPNVSVSDSLSVFSLELLGANNTNRGIFGADLAPAAEIFAGTATSGVGLVRGGARFEVGNWKQAGEWFFPKGTRGPHFHFGSGPGLQSHHLPWESGNWLRNLGGLARRGEAGADIGNISLVAGGVAAAGTAAASRCH